MRTKRLLPLVLLACLAAPTAAAAARPGAPGSIDRGFGRDGLATLRDPYLSFLPSFLAEQPGGRLLVGADAAVPGSSAGPGFVVARFDRRGQRDMSFGTRGRVEAGLSAAGAASLPGGGFFVAGVSGTQVSAEARIVRYTARGLLAPGFAAGSKPVATLNSIYRESFAVAADAQGRMLVAPHDGSVYRLTADGAPDASFGAGGKVTPTLSSMSITVNAIAVQADGRILLGGERRALTGNGAAETLIARLMPDGSIDDSFGGPGSGRIVEENTADWREVEALALDRTGAIFATGSSNALAPGSRSRLPLWRIPADGVGGRIAFAPTTSGLHNGTGLALDRAGNLLVLDSGSVGLQQSPLLFRLRPDASLDRGFGRSGRVSWNGFSPIAGPLLLRDGRIVVALGRQLGEQTDAEETPADVAIVRIARLWGGYDRVAPVIGVRLSCAGRKTVARLRVRDRSRISRLDVWIAGRRLYPVSHKRVKLVLRRTGKLRVVAIDQAGNRARRTVRVTACALSG